MRILTLKAGNQLSEVIKSITGTLEVTLGRGVAAWVCKARLAFGLVQNLRRNDICLADAAFLGGTKQRLALGIRHFQPG